MTSSSHPTNAATRSRSLLAAAVLLALTAVFHLTGLPMAAGWLDGMEGRIVEMLWVTPAVGWLVVAGYWLHLGWSGRASDWPALVVTALLPLIVALPLLTLVSPVHPGGYMLIGASVLALLGRKGRR